MSTPDPFAEEYAQGAQAVRDEAEEGLHREGMQLDRAAQEDDLLSVSLLDLDRNPPPPVDWLIEDLVPRHEFALLFGKPFGGKSLLCLQMGLHAAAGLGFLALPDGKPPVFGIARPLRVLYIDEEMGLKLLWKRIRLMLSGRPEFNDPAVLERFRVVSRKGLRLDDAAKLDLLRREISAFPGGRADLVFFDTLRRMHLAAEKDSELMAKIMGTTIALGEEFGCATVPIHHSKKGPQDDDEDWRESARGSGDLVAASQAVIGMLKTGSCLFTARADTKAAGEIQPFPLLLDEQTLLFRRQSEDERFASKDAQHEAAVKEATGELCRTLGKLKRTGGDKYPVSWTKWRVKAKGNGRTLEAARDRILKPDPDTGRDAPVREIKRRGPGGGKLYIFAEDYDDAIGTSTRTRSEETDE